MVVMPSTTPSSSSKKVKRHNIPLRALGSGRSEGFVPRKIVEGFKDDAEKRINSFSYSRFRNLLTQKKVLRINIDDDNNHDDDQRKLVDDYNTEIEATTVEKHVKKRNKSSVRKHLDTSKFLMFKAACNRYRAACMTENEIRTLRMIEKPVDPLGPASEFRHKLVPKLPRYDLTSKDQQEWKNIPPCVSIWKNNNKDYDVTPLEKRTTNILVDQDHVQMNNNDNLDTLLEALYVSEHKNREEVALRSKIRGEISQGEISQGEICMKEKERRYQQVRMVLVKLRSRRSMLPSSSRVVMKQEEKERTL